MSELDCDCCRDLVREAFGRDVVMAARVRHYDQELRPVNRTVYGLRTVVHRDDRIYLHGPRVFDDATLAKLIDADPPTELENLHPLPALAVDSLGRIYTSRPTIVHQDILRFDADGVFETGYPDATGNTAALRDYGRILCRTDDTIAVQGPGEHDPFQRLTFTAVPTGGTFRVTFLGHSVDIPMNGTLSDLESIDTSLESLPNVGAGIVSVAGNSNGGFGPPFDVRFGGPFFGQNIEQMTVDGTNLIGADVSVETINGSAGPIMILDDQGHKLHGANAPLQSSEPAPDNHELTPWPLPADIALADDGGVFATWRKVHEDLTSDLFLSRFTPDLFHEWTYFVATIDVPTPTVHGASHGLLSVAIVDDVHHVYTAVADTLYKFDGDGALQWTAELPGAAITITAFDEGLFVTWLVDEPVETTQPYSLGIYDLTGVLTKSRSIPDFLYAGQKLSAALQQSDQTLWLAGALTPYVLGRYPSRAWPYRPGEESEQ